MRELPLKISRAIICKKARELRHNNLMGQGESILCNFAERVPMPKGSRTPRRKPLDHQEVFFLTIVILNLYLIFNLKRV